MFAKSAKDAGSSIKKGNMLMLAIGLLLGAVFGALVGSLAKDVIGAYIAHNFTNGTDKEWVLSNGIKIGNFIAAIIDFVITTTFVFVLLFGYFLIRNLIKQYKEKKNPTPAPAPAAPTTEELILAELRKMNEFNSNRLK
ncbi:MscL family protein [Mycoplasma sp. Pen4]|nr:MscL family protein [Mycoplasma sp. Pen4]